METQEEKLVPELRFPEFSGEWEEKKLGEVCLINPKTKKLPNNFFYIDLEGVKDGILSKDVKVIDKKNAPSRAQRLLRLNDILYQTVRPYQRNNYYFDLDVKVPFVASTGYAQLRCTENNTRFLFQLLHTSKFVNSVMRRCTGTSYPAINSTDLGSINIKLPTIPEQQKIGDFFYKIDKKLELQQQKVDNLKEYKKGMMQRIFSQEIRFKDENGNDYPDWEEKRLGDIFKINAGGDIDGNKVSKLKTETMNIPIYANALVNDGLYGYTDEWKVEEESITVTGRGTIGYAIARHEKYYPIVRLLVLRPIIDCNIDFFAEAINKIIFYNEASGVPQLTSPQLGKYKIKFPIKEEQIKIANFLLSIDKKIELEEEKLEEYKHLKKGLMQRMFI